MRLITSFLLGSAAGLAVVSTGQAADLPTKAAAPIEYVRVCSAYGAGFFYIPGTDTCLRVSGRARGEYGYVSEFSRRGPNNGDLSQFRGLLRINVDARTQTDYGTLRAFVRLEAASRTGQTKMSSGTQARIGNAFFGIGQDAYGRVQDFIVAEKAFIQFAGLTAGRASSFFDFYAHDFEIIGSSLGSDLPSTNLLAYTHKFGDGFTATLALEDPNFRKTPIYSPFTAPGAATGSPAIFAPLQTAPSPIILTQDATGNATGVAFVDVVQRSRLPDFVGSLRYDAAWGSAQLSAAVKDVNTAGFLGTPLVAAGQAAISAAQAQQIIAARGNDGSNQTVYGWAVQGGVKVNLPTIAPGDALYVQGAYGEGANAYTGIGAYSGLYTSQTNIAGGNPFNHWLSDAILNPLTGKVELTKSFTVVASFLHYWSPQWRSAFYGSYGEIYFSEAARRGISLTSTDVPAAGVAGNNIPPSIATNPNGYRLSSTLLNSGQIVTGASLIWSPVKDLDIGVEGQYIRLNSLRGRVNNIDRPNTPVASEDTFQTRLRVQRDF